MYNILVNINNYEDREYYLILLVCFEVVLEVGRPGEGPPAALEGAPEGLFCR